MKLSRRIMLSGMALALMLMGIFGQAQAQSTTKLSVEPQMGTVYQDAVIELRFEVEAAQNLNAFELRVNYDAALLEVSGWDHGDLLSNLATVRVDDEQGSFRIVATQLATPGVDGDGTLFKLSFKGKSQGTSPITIAKADFARSDGGSSSPELRHGSLTVTSAPPTETPKPSATPTKQPTATATLIIPPTRTSTITPVPSQIPQASATPLPTTQSGGGLAGTPTQRARASATATLIGGGGLPAGVVPTENRLSPEEEKIMLSTQAAMVAGEEAQGISSGTLKAVGELKDKPSEKALVDEERFLLSEDKNAENPWKKLLIPGLGLIIILCLVIFIHHKGWFKKRSLNA